MPPTSPSGHVTAAGDSQAPGWAGHHTTGTWVKLAYRLPTRCCQMAAGVAMGHSLPHEGLRQGNIENAVPVQMTGPRSRPHTCPAGFKWDTCMACPSLTCHTHRRGPAGPWLLPAVPHMQVRTHEPAGLHSILRAGALLRSCLCHAKARVCSTKQQRPPTVRSCSPGRFMWDMRAPGMQQHQLLERTCWS